MKAILKARYRGWQINGWEEVERPPLPTTHVRAPLRPHYVTRVDGPKEELKPYSKPSRTPARSKCKRWDEDEIEALKEYTEMLRAANYEITPREVAEMALEREVVNGRTFESVRSYVRDRLWQELPEPETESEDLSDDSIQERAEPGARWSPKEISTLREKAKRLIGRGWEYGVKELAIELAKSLPGRTPEAIRTYIRDRAPDVYPKVSRRRSSSGAKATASVYARGKQRGTSQ